MEDLGHKLNEMSKNGQWDEMTQQVSDDVVRLFTAVGRFDEIAPIIEERFGGAVDVVSCDGLPADLIEDLAMLPIHALNAGYPETLRARVHFLLRIRRL